MTRAEADAVLAAHGWHPDEVATLSERAADWIATGLADPRRVPPSWSEKRSHKSTSVAPDDPTTEEIAHAADAAVPPLKHRAAEHAARQARRGALVARGRQIAQRDGLAEATLIALANIAERP